MTKEEIIKKMIDCLDTGKNDLPSPQDNPDYMCRCEVLPPPNIEDKLKEAAQKIIVESIRVLMQRGWTPHQIRGYFQKIYTPEKYKIYEDRSINPAIKEVFGEED